VIWIFVLIFIGLFFWLANLNLLSLSRDWPVILIILGIFNLCGIFRKSRKQKIIEDLEDGKITVEEAEEKIRNVKQQITNDKYSIKDS